jgi:outer membrane murein-binding lipoprotein Lpp
MRVSGLRRPSAGDDTGSLMLAMLLTIVIVGASVVLGTTVVAQIQGTGTDVRRDVELNAAQSGIEVALAQIRATVREGDGTGALAQLPCDSSAAAKRPNAILTGSVGNGGATPNYSVNV